MPSVEKMNVNRVFLLQLEKDLRGKRTEPGIGDSFTVNTGTQRALKNKYKRTVKTIHKIRITCGKFVTSDSTLQIFFLKQPGFGFLLFQAGEKDVIQSFEVNRFKQIIRDAKMDGFSGIFKISISGEDHKAGVKVVPLHFFDHIQSVHHRHGNVCENQFRFQFQNFLKTVPAVFADTGNLKIRVIFGDEKRKPPGNGRFIFDDKYVYHNFSFICERNFLHMF